MRTTVGCLVLGMVLTGCNILTPSLSSTDCEIDVRWEHAGLSTWFTVGGDSLELYPTVLISDDSSGVRIGFRHYGDIGETDFSFSIHLRPETGVIELDQRVSLHVFAGDVMEEHFQLVEDTPSVVELHTVDLDADMITGAIDMTFEIDHEMVETYRNGERRSFLPERVRFQAESFAGRIWNVTERSRRRSEMLDCWLESGESIESWPGGISG